MSGDERTWTGLDVRINGPFNRKSSDEMVDALNAFMQNTGIEEIYRIHFEKGMFMAQHPQSLDDEKTRIDYEYTLRTPQLCEEDREDFLNLPHEEKKEIIGRLRSSEYPAYRGDFLALTTEEAEFIRRDKLALTDDRKSWRTIVKKWNLPPMLWRLVTLCALGALVQGWDQSAVSSAQLYYQDAWKIWIEPPEPGIRPEPWKLGIVNSAPYLCCVLSCSFTYPLNKRFGRRWTIFISCLFSAGFALAQAFAQSWKVMFLFRFLMGLGIGPKSATIPIYSAEAAPQNVRGGLVMMWQVFTAFGIMLGYLAGVALRNVGAGDDICSPSTDSKTLLETPCSLKWRLMIGSPMVAPILLMLYIFTLPESPRWLVAKGHRLRCNERLPKTAKRYYKAAFEGLMKLRHTKLQAARDLFLIYHLLEREQQMVSYERDNLSGWYQSIAFQLVSIRRNRRALIASLTCMFAQQFWYVWLIGAPFTFVDTSNSGVNVLVYYSSEVLKSAGAAGKSGILVYSMGFGIINFVLALPAFYLIDAFGRRSLLLVTFPLLGVSQLLTAFAFVGSRVPSQKFPDVTVTNHWQLAIVGMYLFGVFYSPGEGPVPFVYAAESMPLYIRDIGMGCVTSVNWFFDWLIAFTVPRFFEAFGPAGAFLWYALWCFALWFLIFLQVTLVTLRIVFNEYLSFVPETRMLSLEQLDVVFKQPTREFWRWAWNEEARWIWGCLKDWRKAAEEQRPQFYDRLALEEQSVPIELRSRASSIHGNHT